MIRDSEIWAYKNDQRLRDLRGNIKHYSTSLCGVIDKRKENRIGNYLMQRADSLEKTLMLGSWRQEEKGTTEDEIVVWHHRLDGHEFGQTLGVGDGQEAWHAVIHGVTRSWTRLSNWTELSWSVYQLETGIDNCSAFVRWHSIRYLKCHGSTCIDLR